MSEDRPGMNGGTDVRPIVRTAPSGNRALWIIGGGLVIGGLLLFNALEARRQNMMAATERPSNGSSGLIAPPPPLNLPPDYDVVASPYPNSPGLPANLSQRARPAPTPQIVTRVVERVIPATPPPLPPAQQPYIPPMPVVVESPAPAERGDIVAAGQSDRVMATRLRNPALTVPQGTIIAAVLETALDSTRPGAARAVVSRDVKSFDGSKVLIPRGSRLYGEYASDMAAGQKRALVRWRRLTRPDAVIIDLNSPAADPLGRAGIGGKVDTHFFERFGGAILQSVLDIGVAAVSRSVTDYPVVVALPGSSTQISGVQPQQVQPTLKVQQGTSVSVFVARDLDFSTVDR